MNIASLFDKGVVGSGSEFFRIPSDYSKYLPPVLRVHSWDTPLAPALIDTEGIAYIILANVGQSISKQRKAELDGLQLMVDAIWAEGRTDLFDLPICCSTEYMCFRIFAAPIEMWLQDEPPLAPFLTVRTTSDPAQLAVWEQANPPVASALRAIAQRIPQCGLYPVQMTLPDLPDNDSGWISSIALSVNRQRLQPVCPIHIAQGLWDTPPDDATVSAFVDKVSSFKSIVTNPLVFRRVLKESGIRIRHLGKVLLKLDLPILKQLVVSQMLDRCAKWTLRSYLFEKFQTDPSSLLEFDNNEPLRVLSRDASMEESLIKAAVEYFKVPYDEISPFVTIPVNFVTLKVALIDFALYFNRSIFPHGSLLGIAKGHFPGLKIIHPFPRTVSPSSLGGGSEGVSDPIETLSLRYAEVLFSLEFSVAQGDLLNAAVVLGDLVEVLLEMRAIEPVEQNREKMKLKIIALCQVARSLVPSCFATPTLIQHAFLECVPSVPIYEMFRREICDTESPDSVALISLDLLMAKQVFESDPVFALRLLDECMRKADKNLGARHAVTISCCIRKGQAIRQVLELNGDAPGKLVREGIQCLSRAISASSGSNQKSADTVSHHLLALFYLWNGEAAKAVDISRQGVARAKSIYSALHPRYLNSAYMHAKLLEGHAATADDPVTAVAFAREAVDVLEMILTSLQDLSAPDSVNDSLLQELAAVFGESVSDSEIDLNRKLAITALILKLNVWLLDAATASDLLDIVVSSQLGGARGVLLLPTRAAVKEAVANSLAEKMEDIRLRPHEPFPSVELSSSLPADIVDCCNMALLANAKGMEVSDWFHVFIESTMRSIGDTDTSSSRNRLITLFLTFVYVSTSHTVYVGPLSLPLIPRQLEQLRPSNVLYKGWDRSATLYSIDHDILPWTQPNSL